MSSRLVWIVVAVGLALTLFAWRAAERVENEFTQAHFEAHAMERSMLIGEQFETTGAVLEDLGSLFAVNDEVTSEQFSRFAAPMLARQPSIRALSWNRVVRDAEREAHEAAMRAAGWDGFTITARSADGELVAAPPGDVHVVVTAIEPYAGNESALGFDVSSQSTRREALARARDSGAVAIAAPISLVQSQEKSVGALGFIPRYRSGAAIDTVDQRRAAIEGYFAAVLDIQKNIAAAVAGMHHEGVALTVLCSEPGEEPFVLYSSTGSAATLAASPADPGGRPSYATTFPWGGHEVEVRFVASDAYAAEGHSWLPLGVLVAGLLLTALAASTTGVLWGRTVRIADEVADRTRELEDANTELQGEIARRTAVESRLEEHHRTLARIVEERTAELKATSAQLRAIVESEPECVKIITADGKLEDMNAAGLAMIEADSLDEVRGADVYSLISEKDRDAFIELNRRVIAGESAILEFELDGLRGGHRRVETHAVPLVDPDGGDTRHLAITRDVTERRAAEREQAELENQLRQKQKLESIGVMAGGIAHDFNNILQVIVGNSEAILERDDVDDATRRSVAASYNAAIDAARLCDQMLTYAGRQAQDMKSIHPRELVASMSDLLRVSHSKNAELDIRYDDDLAAISGDEAQLRQVVVNLVRNASEAIGVDAGRIVVRVQRIDLPEQRSGDEWIEAAPPAGRYIGIEVSDTGCGMDAETREKMFDPFFTTKVAGRGLGLSSTLGIIRSHDGYLRVVSEPGSGTRVTAVFPLAQEADPAALVTSSAGPAAFDETIMIVDDEERVRRVGCSVLERLGCRVITAAGGEEAVRRFKAEAGAIDAILLDVAMPRMNGNDTCRELRRIRADIPVIFCSGYADDAVSTCCDETGFTGFLHKPYSRDDLVRALHEALGGATDTAA